MTYVDKILIYLTLILLSLSSFSSLNISILFKEKNRLSPFAS
jgi:hypothetical protein